jgi:hypothetical protein
VPDFKPQNLTPTLNIMTTKAPSSVKPAPDTSVEKIAYACVEGIPAKEPHDVDRLGYNVWRWITMRKDPLEIAVRSAGARLLISEEEAVRRITAKLREHGIDL